jgi:F-type H+-transporting ATPase subunit epsilon
MELKIFTPEKIVFQGEADSISLPTPGGVITVLSKHTSLVTPLSGGTVKIQSKEGVKKFIGEGGVFEISGNKATLLLRSYREEAI